MRCPQRPEEGVLRASGAGVASGCELPRECCELTSGPLQEQDMSLTTDASLQLWASAFNLSPPLAQKGHHLLLGGVDDVLRTLLDELLLFSVQ